MTIQDALQRRLQAYGYRKAKITRKINFLAVCRLVVAIMILLGFSFSFGNSLALQGASLFIVSSAIFLFLMVIHDRCYKYKERLEIVEQLIQDDLARATWRFDALNHPSTMTFENGHSFAHDLDFDGPHSLLKLLDNTYHDQARAMLKGWIDSPDSADAIRQRQEAVAELTDRRLFRQNLALAAHLNKVPDLNADMLSPWLSEKAPWSLSLPAYLFGRVLSLATVGTVVAHFFFEMDVPWVQCLVVQILIFYAFDKVHNRFNMTFMSSGKAISAICSSVRTFEQTPLQSPMLRQLKDQLLVDGNKAGKSLGRLIDLHDFLAYRTNGLAHFVLNSLLMWDQHFLFRLAAWRRNYGDNLPSWVNSIFVMEALSSVANYRQIFGGPFPTLKEEQDIFLKAQKLAHPCIPAEERVGNDYTMDTQGHLHLITGSNMSGKSTFLRTVGTNLVLSRVGAPVCAESLTTTLPRLWTSIHIQDSLAQGVSYFYAEVKRIKTILEEIGSDERPVFYLMDEILKGTNSQERLIATKAMVHYLLDHKASGLITTHDLELLAIQKERPEEVTNYHFQEQVDGEKMFFDYCLKNGELTSTNALRVMRHAGVPLVFEEE